MKAGTQIVKIIMMTVIIKNREYLNDHNNPRSLKVVCSLLEWNADCHDDHDN
jgi:hypothetical protein